MFYILHVEEYDFGFVVVEQVIYHVRFGYVTFVAETYEFADGYYRFELAGLEAEKEFNAIGQGDEIAETRSKIKKKGGEENEPDKS